MKAVRREGGKAVSALAATVILAAFPPSRLTAQAGQGGGQGKLVYEQWCSGCHGTTGAGDGYAASRMLPRPRDFTRAVFQIRTTASGELPTDADLRHVVDEGMPGTAMPAWKSRLTAQERGAVVAYLKTFSTFFQGQTPTATAIASAKAPRATDETIKDGRATFEKLECFKCHGELGRGDGKSAPTLKDDWDQPIKPADLTEGWNFNGGYTVEQIYTRLRTGLDGTPMPSFSDAIDAKIITDEQLWHLAQYIRSLSPEQPPESRDVMRAAQVAALPKGPDDSAWAGVERYYVPLVGQVIQKPRWFAPAVNTMWVQAVHDGKSLALRLTWHDGSRSPDPAWDQWLGRMQQAMTEGDAPVSPTQGPDRLTVQFPLRSGADVERPYFLGGSSRRPVYVWRWSSEGDNLQEGTGTGLGSFKAASGAEAAHVARYDRGEWQLQITRPLVPQDSTAATPFPVGETIPIAFFAADGSNGETDVQGSISAWYAIYPDVPPPRRVYLAPVVAVLVTAGAGLVVVRRAQRGNPRA